MRNSGHIDLQMNKKINILTVLAVWLLFLPIVKKAGAEEATYKEHEIKAAYIFKFVNFIDGWRFQQESGEDKEKDAGKERSIIIGVIGRNPFRGAFVPYKDKQVKNRKIIVKYYKGYSELNSNDEKVTIHPRIKQIKQCDLLFICSSEKDYIDNILDPIRHERILTISEIPGFLESGGIINFVMERDMVRFEINTAGVNRAKLQIRSKMLRLAKRIITKDDIDEE